MPRKTDKRVRLIEAARILIHQQGFNLTTLANIAETAGVPLGNVYYYFKKKEDIGESVIERLASSYNEIFKKLTETAFTPLDRLKALLKYAVSNENLDQIARYGCPLGGLSQELSKQGGPLADQAAKLVHDLLSWSENQFHAMGCGAESHNLALHLVACLQGSYLLTQTFKDPKFTIEQAEVLLHWIEKINIKHQSAAPAKEAQQAEAFV